MSKPFRRALNLVVNNLYKYEWHLVQILSFSNYILYYPEIFIQLNDLILTLNSSIQSEIKANYSAIVTNTIEGSLTKFKPLYATGVIFGALNSLYIQAFNYTNPRYTNNSFRARAFFKGIESSLSLNYYSNFLISDQILNEEFDLKVINNALEQMASFNLDQDSQTVYSGIKVRRFKYIFIYFF